MKWQVAIKFSNGRVLVKEYASMATAFAASERAMKSDKVISATPTPVLSKWEDELRVKI